MIVTQQYSGIFVPFKPRVIFSSFNIDTLTSEHNLKYSIFNHEFFFLIPLNFPIACEKRYFF